MKTRLLSQSAQVKALVRPVIDGETVTAKVEVTKAMPTGLLGELVKLLDLHSEIKKLVQREIDKELRDLHIPLPKQVHVYNVLIHGVGFIALDGDGLGLDISASGTITKDHLDSLIEQQIVGKVS